MNKKGVTETLVTIIAIAIAAFLLLFAGGKLYAQTKEKGETGQCTLKLLSTKTSVDLPPGCKATRETLTLQDLEPYRKQARERIPKYYETNSPLTQYYKIGDEASEYRWALNKYIAERLQQCWERTGRGTLGFSLGSCLLCNRILLDASVRNSPHFKKQNLKAWLANERMNGQTYLDYIGTHPGPVGEGMEERGKRLSYDIPLTPALAIYYEHGTGAGAKYGVVNLKPYGELTEGTTCTQLYG